MASSYTSPLTVARDVETSILGGAVLESLRAGAHSREDGKKGVGWGRGCEDGGVGEGGRISRGIEQITKYVNTRKHRRVKNGVVNNLADGEDG